MTSRFFCVPGSWRQRVRAPTVAVLVLLGCQPAGASDVPAPPEGGGCASTYAASFEVDMYSGMRNPRLVLEASEAKAIWGLLASLRAPAHAYRMPPDLGFRGYSLDFTCPAPLRARIWGEVVITPAGAFLDPARDLHHLLAARYPIDLPSVLLKGP